MPTDYPDAVDAYGRPGQGASLATGGGIGRRHSEIHDDELDAIEAIEAELGVNPSGNASTVANRLNSIEGTATTAVYIQQRSGAGVTSGFTCTATFDDDVSAGNLLVAFVERSSGVLNPGIAVVQTVTDDQGNRWKQAAEAVVNATNERALDIWYCDQAIGGSAPTVTAELAGFPDVQPAPGQGGMRMVVFEYQGGGYECVDTIGMGSINGTSGSVSTVDAAQANDLLFSAIVSNAEDYTPPPGWTERAQDTLYGFAVADKLDSGTAGVQAAAWSGLTNNTKGTAIIVAFRPGGTRREEDPRCVRMQYQVPVLSGAAYTTVAAPDPFLGTEANNALIAVVTPFDDCVLTDVTDDQGNEWHKLGDMSNDTRGRIWTTIWGAANCKQSDTLTITGTLAGPGDTTDHSPGNSAGQAAWTLLEYANIPSWRTEASGRSLMFDASNAPTVSTDEALDTWPILALAYWNGEYNYFDGLAPTSGWRPRMMDSNGSGVLVEQMDPGSGVLTAGVEWNNVQIASGFIIAVGSDSGEGAQAALAADQTARTPYLRVDDVNRSYASTPDAAALDITGDIGVAVRLACDDWTPTTSASQYIVGKSLSTGNQRSWQVGLNGTALNAGRLEFDWSTDGTNVNVRSSTVAPTVNDGDELWIGFDLDADDGSGNHVVRFYTAPVELDDPDDWTTIPWTRLGDKVTTAGTTSIYSSTAALEIGGLNQAAANTRLAANVKEVIVVNGRLVPPALSERADVRVAHPRFDDQAAWATSFTDAPGRLWSVNAPAVIRDDSRQVPPDPALATAPAGCLGQSLPDRRLIANLAAVTSGTLRLAGLYLPEGTTVTTVSFISGTTAAVNPTNQWFGLFDSAQAALRLTADDTTTAWAANTVKSFALTTPYTTTYSGLYYLGYMVAAGTVPTQLGVSGTSQANAIVPIIGGGTDTGLTTPPALPFTAAAITASTGQPYGWVT